MSTTTRRPARDTYDVFVGLTSHEVRPQMAYALVKRTYRIHDGALDIDKPEPLLHELIEGVAPRPGTDFWPTKLATDVVVRGAAFAPKGAATRMVVSVSVGETQKRAVVFGRRKIHWGRGGMLRIGSPEPFDTIALTYGNAYGGADRRTCPAGTLDHPSVYPRNPLGKGYLLDAGSVTHATEMPNVEDPRDLLTAERLLLDHAQRWYTCPLPVCFDWVFPTMFPRLVWFGEEAHYPAPPEMLPEVKRGFLPSDYRARRGTGIHPRFFQEATPELILDGVKGGEPVTIAGMHPERAQLSLALPRVLDTMSWRVEGERVETKTRLHSVIIEPARERVSLVLGSMVTLPRTFIPGVHTLIPVSVSVSGDRPVLYEASAAPRERSTVVRAVKEVSR